MADIAATPVAKVMSEVPTSRKIGLVATTALVIGNMIGSGIFLLPSSLAPYGLLSLAGWIVTALGALVLALIFARLSRVIVGAGGPYAYSRLAYGDFAGFWIAWGYWIALWAGNAAIAVAFVGYAAAFFPAMGVSTLFPAGATAIALVWILTFVNLLGADVAGRVQTITTIIKLIPLLLVGIVGLFFFNSANPTVWQPTEVQPNALTAVAAVVALTLWAFLGLESATVATTEVENPTVIIPRATLIGTAITAIIYIASSTAVIGLVPGADLAVSTFPFADAARVLFGDWGFYGVALGAAISALGALNGFVLITPQVSAAAADDRLFPKRFAERSNVGVPRFGMIVAATLISILLIFNYSGNAGTVQIFNFIILLATLTTLLPYAFCSLVELIQYFKSPADYPVKNMFAAVALAVIGFIYSVIAIIGSGASTVLWGFVLMLLGLPVYVWMQRERREE
jgi:APA family basic amino acid/polyamine antiporter